MGGPREDEPRDREMQFGNARDTRTEAARARRVSCQGVKGNKVRGFMGDAGYRLFE